MMTGKRLRSFRILKMNDTFTCIGKRGDQEENSGNEQCFNHNNRSVLRPDRKDIVRLISGNRCRVNGAIYRAAAASNR